jgi:hypothetical protein
MSKFSCHCGELADLWRSRTTDNPGRLFIKCGMAKVRSFVLAVQFFVLVFFVWTLVFLDARLNLFLVLTVEMQVLEVGGRTGWGWNK